jgi:chromate reductase, NAD(P)H dehydrogenase (quinone)
MTNLAGISGSLRRGSFNTALLNAAARLLPSDVTLTIRTLHGIPLYDADGVILATPEYNNGMPGVFKNAIDWMSRPPADIQRVFGGKPVAIIGASPGGFGTVMAQSAWLPVLRTLGTKSWFGGRLLLSRAQTLFDSVGNLTDAASQQQLRQFIQSFADFVRKG